MKSRTPGPFGQTHQLRKLFGCRTPGPVGRNDFADPLFWIKRGFCRVLGDTPGTLGVNDYASQTIRRVPAKKNLPQGTPTVTGPLQVTQGQVTFDAEGNDIASSPYYSRKIHWPGNAESGVTLGRGYDMGNRTKEAVKADLIASGMAQDTATKFAEAAQKKGESAKKFVADNQKDLGEISREIQKSLFELIYPQYIKRAKNNYEKWTKDSKGELSGKVAWDDLHWAIRDILVDFVYQGFTKGANPMVKGMKNDFDELIKYIEGSTVLQKYEAGRGRVKYLKQHKPVAQPASNLKPALL